MKNWTKVVVFLFALVFAFATFTGCELSGSVADRTKMIKVANNLQEKQPTPMDIEYSLQRYNLIRRAYWVNGMREKARMLPCTTWGANPHYVIML